MQENVVVLHCLKEAGCDSVRTANTSANKYLKHQWEETPPKNTNRTKLFIIKGIRFYFYTHKVKNMHFKIFTMTIYEITFVNETPTYSTRIYPPNDKVYVRRKCNRKRERGK